MGWHAAVAYFLVAQTLFVGSMLGRERVPGAPAGYPDMGLSCPGNVRSKLTSKKNKLSGRGMMPPTDCTG